MDLPKQESKHQPLGPSFRVDNPQGCYYNKIMQYEWDENKNAANKVKHGVDFGAAERFCWETALETIDDRAGYDEKRWIALE